MDKKLTARMVEGELKKTARKEKVKILSSFFKTGKGEYGEGDIFIGVNVPSQRKIASKYIDLDFNEIKKLLASKVHEFRLTALIILLFKYNKSKDEVGKKRIFDFYLRNKKYVNNWDLVDISSRDIVGDYLFNKDRSIILKLSKSKIIWDRRIAIISTYYFIKQGECDFTLSLVSDLLKDKEDLMHKACGWMLREIGKKDEKRLRFFLDKNVQKMPRTMLRYAIERLKEKDRQKYLKN